MHSSRARAIVRFIVSIAIAGVICFPIAVKALDGNDLGWWAAFGSEYMIILSGIHRAANTKTVNNWLDELGIGRDDKRTIREKRKDRREARRKRRESSLDDPPYSGE